MCKFFRTLINALGKIIVVFFIASPFSVLAEKKIPLSDSMINNLGSGYGFAFLCHSRGLIEDELFTQYLRTFAIAFFPDDFERVKEIGQQTVNNKKMYSPSRDKWIKFPVDAETCSEIAGAMRTAIVVITTELDR